MTLHANEITISRETDHAIVHIPMALKVRGGAKHLSAQRLGVRHIAGQYSEKYCKARIAQRSMSDHR